ncbi:MAG TPA: hypothetical protein ENJ87_05920 [Gammaproteobacteria bacterium]|nr:hypothetical protein [Gammaproteobacteria bacterium]
MSKFLNLFVFLLALIVLTACGGEGDAGSAGTIPPIGDMSGSWQISSSDSSSTPACDGVSVVLTATIVQSGNDLMLTGLGSNSLNGSISGDQMTWAGSYPEDGGTTTISTSTSTITSDCNQFTGNDSWSWSDGTFSCSGTSQFTATRLTGSGCSSPPQGSGSLVQITTNAGSDSAPDWSADGTKIVFNSNRTGNKEIWIMNADGSSQTQLTNTAENEGHPHFSPDGTQIVFWSERSGFREIWKMNSDGSGQSQITNDKRNNGGAAWSPDGTKIVFRRSNQSGNNDIWMMDPDGTNLTQLTSNTVNDGSPQFSPDGTQIVFSSNRTGNYDIWMMNVDGSNPVQLTTSGATDQQAHFSQDGTKLVYESWSGAGGDSNLWVMNRDGTNQTQVTTFSGSDGRGDFNPDGTQIVYQSTRSGNFDIWIRPYN